MDESTARSRHPDSLRQALLWTLVPTLVLFLTTAPISDAQEVTTSITSTIGTGDLGTTVTHTGAHLYDIGGGTRSGDGTGPILFHSFGDFSIGQSDIANFFNDSGLTTTNIIGRVTGGNPSSIDGIIQTTGFDNANLFLVNPFGIVFGPHGSFDVGGSVSFSTAQYLRLFNSLIGASANFYANPTSDGMANSVFPVFAMAPVDAFGFLPSAYGFVTAPDPGATITVLGSALSVLPGQSISLVGRDVVIQGDTLPDGTVLQPAHLSAPNGTIHLASTASPGEFDVTMLQPIPNVDGTSFTSFGSVSLAPASSIDVSGARTVFVKGGQLVLSINDATLTTSESTAQQDTITLSQGSSIVTSTSGVEPGADVQITVGNLNLNGVGTGITTETAGDGNGGNLTLNIKTLLLTDSAGIFSNGNQNFLFGQGGLGLGGNVTIQGLGLQGTDSAAESISLTDGAKIQATSGGLGGGSVRITTDTLKLENQSGISTQTDFGDGVGGELVLEVRSLTLMGGLLGHSEIRSTNGFNLGIFGTALGGDVTIRGTQGEKSAAESVTISGGSQVFSETDVSGDGGRISITTTSLDLSGRDTNGMVSAINSSTLGTGVGGPVVLDVQQLSLSGGANIASHTASADTSAPAGGSITVQGLEGTGSKATSVVLSGQNSGIVSDSSSGLAGPITVDAEMLKITNGATVSAGSSTSIGPSGSVDITADSIVISADGQIFSRSFAQAAGPVTITANNLTLDNGSVVTNTSSEIGGLGGNMVLDVGTVSLTNGASINSQTFSTGRAGDITMNVGTVSLRNGSSISSASTGTAPVTNLLDGTTEPPGTAGNVVITATGSFTSDASTVATSAEANHGGDISITAHSVQLSGGTLITANSNAPLEVTKLVLDANGQLDPKPQLVGDGNAGNITIASASNVVMQNSSVTTEASAASGGNIEIDVPNAVMLQLVNSRVSTSVGGIADKSDGGNITIDPQFVVLQNSQILAQAVAGAGGAISITATSAFITDPLSIVDASSTLGISGTVNIQSPLQNVGGELTALTQEFSSAAALLAQQCAARAVAGKFSTFVVAAREGLPVEPGGFLASPSLTAELLGSRLSGLDPQTQLSAVTGLFSKYDARPIQLARFGEACHRQ